MEKIAQSRSKIDTIFRDRNPFNSAIEYFSTDVANIMADIRKKDNLARNVFTSKNSPEFQLSSCKSAFKYKEYMKCIMYLDNFKDGLEKASSIFENLNDTLKIKYKNVFIEKLKNKEKKELIQFRQKMDNALSKKSSIDNELIIKSANLSSFFNSFFTQRGRSLRAWEKAHQEDVLKLKEGIVELMDLANDILKGEEGIYFLLKEMSFAISKRDVSGYIKNSKKFKKHYNMFNEKFVALYKNVVKDLIDTLKDEEDVSVDTSAEDSSRKTMLPELPASKPMIGTATETGTILPPAPSNSDKDKGKGKGKGKKTSWEKAKENLLKIAKSI